MSIAKGKTVLRHTITGETGVYVGHWFNCANQRVVNVKVDGLTQSWIAAKVVIA